VSFKRALNEINRVLKLNGVLVINAPIHVHGHPFFLRGNLKKINKLFDKNLWNIKLFDKCIPNKKLKRWKKLGDQGWQSKVGYPDFLIPHHKEAFSYILNIHAIKKSTSKLSTKKDKLREIKVILRFIKEYLLVKLLLR
ncbi:unnamed protein product, partial [marine sediment metagenome]